MSIPFSFASNQKIYESIDTTVFDLLVIGGGITGAGIALDATQRGLKVCLIEKEDYASGTSSRSTKLIHGGLRYLKQMEFKLVHDVGTERSVVYHNAMNLVRPEKMILPITKSGSLSKTLTSIALWTYDFLGGVKKAERKRMLNKDEILALEPLLKHSDLLSGGLYYEYRTDDARLCMANILSAHRLGTTCFTYTEAVDFIYDQQHKICGVLTKNSLTQAHKKIQAKVVVNAAGPWVDQLRKIDKSLQGKKLQLTKGVHLVIPKSVLAIQHAIYFDTDDQRMIFCIPRQNITYIGTTDTVYNESADNPRTSLKDVEYLLKQVNNRFENTDIGTGDIISSWSGLRPLIYEEGKSASELSRKDEIFVSDSGLISMAGGKLTGYRLMAEQLVTKVLSALNKPAVACATKNTVLSGCEFSDENEIQRFIDRKFGECRQIKLSYEVLSNWVYRYGKNTDVIIEIAFEKTREIEARDLLGYSAELCYTIDHEQVVSLSDFLIRRTGMMYFEREKLTPELIESLQNILIEKIDLPAAIHTKNRADFNEAYLDCVRFN